MKKVKILCLRTDAKQASYRYRIEQFLPHWQLLNIDFDDQLIVGQSFLKRLKIIRQASNYDFVLLHKKTLSAFLVRMIKKRSRLIFDYDDALYAIESYKKDKPKDSQPGSKTMIRRLNYILEQSDMVFAGSPALKEYSEKFAKQVFLVPTSLPIPNHNLNENDSNSVQIGWIGNRFNLYYLQEIDLALFEIQSKFPQVVFSLMCSDLPLQTKTKWQLHKWSKEAELNWLNSIDIGLMPLNDDEWSRGKCAFKLIQYMSHKKPVVASNVGANKDAVKNGETGFLVESNTEWFDALKTLVENPEKRKEMGAKGFDLFSEKYELGNVAKVIGQIVHGHLAKYKTVETD